MDDQERYPHPPIVESVLEILIEPPGDLTLTKLLRCQEEVKNEYPEVGDWTTHKGRWTIAGATSGVMSGAAVESQRMGHLFHKKDSNKRFIAATSGFVYAQLEPYDRWESFFSEAKRLWSIYYRIARPRVYKRIALRNINRIDIPGSSIELDDYFFTKPTLGEGIPQAMSGYFFDVTIPIPDIKSHVTIIQTLVPPPKPGENITSVLLDVDLYKTEELPDGSNLLAYFETLHLWKNRVFNLSITEKTKELFRHGNNRPATERP
jgi:uncharacterized protein (TIGR04255 family)